MFRKHQIPLLAAVLLCLMTVSAAAADIQTFCDADYCFSPADFSSAETQLSGVFVTEVPSGTVGTLRCGRRVLRSGDVIPAGMLDKITLVPNCSGDRTASVSYLPVTDAGVGAVQTLRVQIRSNKNHAPTVPDLQMETYRNISNHGKLEASDRDGNPVRYALTSAPKRGTVEVHEDGSFTYTPAKNKVGTDSFTYTATDDAGETSNTGTVQIEILKPVDKLTYSDMTGDPDQFTALWLHDCGIFSGETIGSTACFSPDKPVTRGEFLVMASMVTGLDPEEAQLTSGFSDNEATPVWMRPYVVSALRSGMVTGIAAAGGMEFRPAAVLTHAEAAVMLQNLLQLPSAKETAVFSADSDVPAWAEDALSALYGSGMPLSADNCLEPVTRREAARLLYAADQLRCTKTES